MLLKQFSSGPLDTNGYIVGDKEVFFIDAPPGSLSHYQSLTKEHSLLPKGLLLTHSHLDHIGDAKAVAEAFSIPIYIHPLDVSNLTDPGSDGIPLFFKVPSAKPNYLLSDGLKIRLGQREIEVIHTPGHTPGGVCFYFPHEKILFSGDTLFRGTIGNISFPTAEPDRMWASLKRLSFLPNDVVVYPGHGDPTTIGAEVFLADAKRFFS